ncbi:hypothetical protein ACFSQ7_12505 [Paenibacillus rhizoplanae]
MRIRNAILLAASLIFYAWGEPVYIVLMIFSTVFDYVNGILIDNYRHRKVIAQGVLILSMIGSLGILGFFKYAGFVYDTINSLFNLHLQAADLPLPVGISFYTFQTMSYVIDVYRGKVSVQKNLISFGAYVTMFPQLVAGPIVKYEDIAGQLVNRQVTLDRFWRRGGTVYQRTCEKKYCLPTISVCCGQVSKGCLRENYRYFLHGSA